MSSTTPTAVSSDQGWPQRTDELFAKPSRGRPPRIRLREITAMSAAICARSCSASAADTPASDIGERETLATAIAALFRRQHIQGPDNRAQRKPEPLRQFARGWKAEPLRKDSENRGGSVQRYHAPADRRIPPKLRRHRAWAITTTRPRDSSPA